MSHSRFSTWTDAEFDAIFASVIADANAISALNPLLILDDLPDHKHWSRHLTPLKDNGDSWHSLGKAIAENAWHQSQIATDVRWMRVVCLVANGRMLFSEGMEEHAKEISEYPNYGDMRKVRPSIRAAEMAFAQPEDGLTTEWPEQFWDQCLKRTHCAPAPFRKPASVDVAAMTEEALNLYAEVAEHFHTSIKTTDIDPKIDAIFGICLYSIVLHATLLTSRSHQRVQGRFFIRTIMELYITLAFLVTKDEDSLWKRYRNYGNGQAKLAFLKLVDLSDRDVPSYVKADELEQLANEDRWEEFLEIDLGNWAKLDLRKMSEEAGVKETYDRFYSWPSGYVHGHWAAVRDTVFDLCVNPLHRYHRVPAPPRLDMGSVAPDSVKLINLTLELLSQSYPPFKTRLRVKMPAPSSEKSTVKTETPPTSA